MLGKITFILLTLLISLSAHEPQLHDLAPRLGQRGTTLELTCHGERLKYAHSIMTYQHGITAGKPTFVDDKRVTFPLTIAADAPLGEHQFHIACTDGTSQLKTFWVGQYPITPETDKSNNSPAEAQLIEKNSTVIGTTLLEDVDYYKIHLEKNQLVNVEVTAMRLGKVFFDSFIAITDAQGSELALCDDSTVLGQDPHLSFIAPSAGEYFILIRDSAYEGNENQFYHMHVGDFPRPMSISPLGAQRGKASTFTSILLDQSALTLQHTLNENTNLQQFYITKGALSSHTPYHVRVTDFEYLTEIEPNDNAAHTSQASTPVIPIAFHGCIQKENDQDWHRFHAKKGQRILFQVYARGLGSPLDSKMILFDAKGKYIIENDDQTQNVPDSKLDFNVPEDGDYWLVITDQLNHGSPHYQYRVELTFPQASIAAALVDFSPQDSQKWKSLNIPQGNRVTYQVNLTKTNTKEDVELLINKIPAGVTLKKVRMIDNDSKLLLYLEADPSAPLSHGLFPLSLQTLDKKLTSNIASSTIQILGPANKAYHETKSDVIPIQVTPAVKVKLEILQPVTAITQSGILPVTIKLQRAEKFDEEVTIHMPWKPAGIGAPATITIPKGQDTAVLNLAADSNAALGKWDFCIRATYNENAGDYQGPVHVSSNVIGIEVAPPLFTGKLALAATEQGVNTSILCDIQSRQNFSGKATLHLYGLPEGITAQPVEISHDTKQIAIPVSVPVDARLGKHGNLFCQAVIKSGEQEITQTLAQGGTLRVNPPSIKKAEPAKEVAAEITPKETNTTPAKPLSRLEELRQKK